jgi:transposase-like protein
MEESTSQDSTRNIYIEENTLQESSLEYSKKYVCTSCPETFENKNGLDTHRRKFHQTQVTRTLLNGNF